MFGYQGDIRFLGANGVLPLDRPQQFKAFGNYAWRSHWNFGLGTQPEPGKPLDAAGRQSQLHKRRRGPDGTSRLRASRTTDGFKTRSPFESQCRHSGASYNLKVAGTSDFDA